ncbi:pyridoxal-phosphate dependent enzyme [Rhodobacterales bacterium HKCCE3408]|nr:pyridoxal-phosphate dependent enzyme [Rhodobacterales bacterium HKCCE3408]
MLTPSPAAIKAAADRIAPHIRRTPVMALPPEVFGHPVHFKLEHLQVTGSFKVRGAFNNLLSREVPPGGVVAASGGNHGAAVAHAATKLGHKSVIFVPKSIAKEEKLRRMRDFGGEVVLHEGTVAECMADYETHATETGAISVHPYDTEWTLAGQGTLAREMEAQIEGLDTVLVAVGGGGLIGGIAAWFGDRVNVVSVETEGTNTLNRSLAEGPDIAVQATGVSAGSLGGPALGKLPYEIATSRIGTALVLTDADVYDAGKRLWEETRMVVEPGGATALAALTSGAYTPEKDERVAVLLCGGNAEPDWFLKG